MKDYCSVKEFNKNISKFNFHITESPTLSQIGSNMNFTARKMWEGSQGT